MNILGISCFYHDSAACLIKDGELVAAVQEERFNRVKASSDFPYNAINYCLQEGDITVMDLDYIGFYEKPYLKFSRVIIDHLRSWPFSFGNFLRTMPNWLQDRLILPIMLKKELTYEGETIFIKHHLSHAASTFLVSPFEEAAIITIDGVGEEATTTLGIGKGNQIDIKKEILYPDSLGLLYTAVTAFLGFKANEHEGKTMGLAAFGDPNRYIDKIREIIDVKPDGSFKTDTSYFGYNKGKTMYSKKFVNTFGAPRKRGEEITQRHNDVAAATQLFVEETILKIASYWQKETGMKNLCLAGGVTLNCVTNQRIIEETPFENVFVQPAAGDAGGALGVALYIYHSMLDNPRTYEMKNAFTGPEYSADDMKRALINNHLEYREMSDDEISKYIAEKISKNYTIGWFERRMEFGPRALGSRSILGNASAPEMKDILNLKIKKREPFRPFAPMVLEEKAKEYFELDVPSPFMLLAPRVQKDKLDKVKAITHVDGTARVQTVNEEQNTRIYRLIQDVEKLTGVPVIINTSFNRQEPIVCSPEEAVSCYLRTQMDYLVLGNYVVERKGLEENK